MLSIQMFKCSFLTIFFSNTEQNGWAKKKLACSLAPQLCRTNCWCLWFVFLFFSFFAFFWFKFTFIFVRFAFLIFFLSFISSFDFSSGFLSFFWLHCWSLSCWYMKISSCLVTVAVNTIAFRWYYRCVNATSSTFDSTRKLYLWNRKKNSSSSNNNSNNYSIHKNMKYTNKAIHVQTLTTPRYTHFCVCFCPTNNITTNS